MPKYMFDVWTEIHGTVEIEADTNDQAWELLGAQMYDAELTEGMELKLPLSARQ